MARQHWEEISGAFNWEGFLEGKSGLEIPPAAEHWWLGAGEICSK